MLDTERVENQHEKAKQAFAGADGNEVEPKSCWRIFKIYLAKTAPPPTK